MALRISLQRTSQEEISSTSSSILNPVLEPKTPSNHSVDRERIVFIMIPVLDSLIGIIMGKLVDAGINEIASILGVKKEMEALQNKVENISLVLVDVETKKIESKAIALWLAELREVLYDAEDLLDDFAAAQRCKSKDVKEILLSITGLSKILEATENSKISTIIKNINTNLSNITLKTPTLQLLATQPNADKKVCRYNSSRITDTCSFQLDSETVNREHHSEMGIDVDAKHLANRIKEESNPAPSLLFAITGMGGIGKTTLARKVFNHQLIENHFQNKVWVCVSTDCTGEYLLKKIVRSIDNNYTESRDSLDELSSKLIEVVKEKKVFIVLDDIWDSRVWEKFLRVPLLKGANCNRILITTRNQQVAMKMNAAHTHPMTEMNSSDGWSMLCKIVFEEKDNGDMNELADVGKKIVDKCKGLPLAIKVVGGVLRMTDRTIDAWTRVLSSTTWSMQDLPEDIPPSLLLSYEDLPSHLRRCFIYCSLFPQDFTFHPTKLLYMWIAEGFIHKEGGKSMEESAKEYYNELVMRNLLQVTLYTDGSSTCKMHDLLHSLAIFVSQNQYIYVDPKTFGGNGLIKHRHLRFNVENMNAVPEEIIGREYVRTLMFSTNTEIKEIPDELLSGLRRLRVLNIEGIIITTLPNSVGNMRQLRFLSISASELHMLPDSIENLENLETLMIASVLKSRSLPKGIGNLHNLRHLLVSDKPENMPNGLNKLKNLRVLDCFVVNDNKPNMKELKDLSELTDLSIYNLERVVSKEEAEEAAIEKKTSLECLKLHCNINFGRHEDIEKITEEKEKAVKKIEEVFAGIEIPKNLTELSIYGFFGEQLPDHMGWSLLHQVKSLELKNCKSLEQLPFMGNMPKLETLHITNLYAVTKLDSDFVGTLKFPKLKDLHLVGMSNLEMMFEVEQGAFPCLVNLLISGCPKLESLGEGLRHATCLKKMTVIHLSELESIENLSSISELKISSNPRLISVKNLPSLKKMDINECFALKVIKDVGEQSSLSLSSSDAETITQPTWSPKIKGKKSTSENMLVETFQVNDTREENGVQGDRYSSGASSSSGTSTEHVDFMDEE